MPHPNKWCLSIGFAVCLSAVSTAGADNTTSLLSGNARLGVLDKPLLSLGASISQNNRPFGNLLDPAAIKTLKKGLRLEFKKELKALKKLPQRKLLEKAKKGERAAQVMLAEDFAKEAAMLAFAPAAANDALSDAVRWYSLAAKRGYPGAPSLDDVGVQFFPIRVQRTPVR